MNTVRDLIRRSMRLVNIIDAAEVPDSDEYQDGLSTLNDMLDNWALESLIFPFTPSSQFSVVAGQKTYSIGPGGDWDNVRPNVIKSANIRIGDSLDIPMEILETEQYQAVSVKGTTSTQSTSLYYDAQVPLAYISLYPVPQVVFDVVLIYDAQFTAVTLDTELTGFAPGIVAALRFNLAVDLAAEYSNKDVSKVIAARAVEYKSKVKSGNIRALDAITDWRLRNGAGRAWDWRIG